MTALDGDPRAVGGRVGHALDGIPAGLRAAYRDAFAGRRLAWASPAVFVVGTYAGLYATGLLLARPSPRLALLAFAVAVGLGGLLAGIGLGWKAIAVPTRVRPVARQVLTRYGLLLLTVGLVALVAYLARIGYIPLFQAGLEQGRVEAAEEGGAPLRVLSLLALPGTWILVAQAASVGDRRRLLLAALAVAVVALGFTLTGNRSPAFTTIEIALIAGLLAAGWDRIGLRGIAILAAIGASVVLAAGLFGAYRLASSQQTYGPPNPFVAAPTPDYPGLTAVAIRGYLVVPIQNLGYTIDAVPEQIGWRYGLTYVQPVLTVLPGKQTTFDADLKKALDQRYDGGGTVPGVLGEAFANFGPIGWFAVPFLLGAGITALYRISQARTPELAALYAYAVAHVSIGAALSGLSVASPFPWVAYAVLGFGVVGLPVIAGRRSGQDDGSGLVPGPIG